jgi:uncharacterized protein YhaN
MILSCTDGLTDQQRLEWKNKVIHITKGMEQPKNDIADNEFNLAALEREIQRGLVTKQEYDLEKAEILENIRVSKNNLLNAERRIGMGPSANTPTVASGAKRGISEISDSNVQDYSSKR